MCTSPQHIRNPALVFDPSCGQLFVDVPCGHCYECVERMRQDLTIRHYYEFTHSLWSYFDTLTYNDANLPKFETLPCFNSKHIIDFMKRIRIALTRKGYILDRAGDNLLKFSLTSEYGHLKGRPHYHIIWFNSVPDLTPKILWSLTRKYWYYGFNDRYIDIQNHIITSINALQYVAKYVGKDLYFENKYEEVLQKDLQLSKLDDLARDYRRLRPFRRASLGFGESIEQVPYDTLVSHGVPYFNKNGKQYMRLPRYNALHMFYDRTKFKDSIIYKLNAYGINYKLDKLDPDLDSYVTKLHSLIINLSPHEQEDFYTALDGRSLRDLAIYQRVFRGCQKPPGMTYYWNLPNYKLFYKDRLSLYDGRYLIDNPSRYALNSKLFDTCNGNTINETSHYTFRNFDYLSNIVTEVFQSSAKNRDSFQNYQQTTKNRLYEICQRYQIIS